MLRIREAFAATAFSLVLAAAPVDAQTIDPNLSMADGPVHAVATDAGTVYAPSLSQAAALQHIWSKIFGDPSVQDARAIAVDPFGNVWVTGMYRGTVNFGGGALPTVGTSDDTAYLAKFNGGGTYLYSVGFAGSTTTSEYGTVLACDASGNVILAGQVSGSINLGGGLLSTAGGTDIFIAKFNNAGVHQWSKRIGDVNNEFPNGVATDGSGNVYLTGFFSGTVDFGGGALTSTSGSNDVFLVSLDPSGNHLWSKRFGETGTQNALGIAASASGDIALTGPFAGSVDFGGGVLTSAGSNDIYVARFSSAGTHVWSKRFGDSATQLGNGVGFDPSGNLIVSGSFQGTVDFGGGGLTTAGGNDIYVAKLDVSGNHVWSKKFGDVNPQSPAGHAVDAGGAIVLSGHFQGSVDFGNGNLTSAGGTDIYVARLDNDGNHSYSARFGDASDQHAVRPKVDPANNVIFAGDMIGSVDFGGGTLTASGTDIFVARFARSYPEIHSIVDVPGDQGGWVRVFFQGSGQDVLGASPAVSTYYLFRRIDNLALAAKVNRAAMVSTLDDRQERLLIEWNGRLFRRGSKREGASATSVLWESVASAPARQQSTDYITLGPTQADSTASSTPYNVYFVMAQTTTPSVYYDSDPDSGYSVDNLAPATPQNLTGAQSFSPDGLRISWQPNGEHDLLRYAVYRETTAGFVPAPGNLIATPAGSNDLDPEWSPSSGYYYKVSAIDLHDNQSGFALLAPGAVTSTGGTPVLPTFLGQNMPNPFNPSTEIRFGVDASPDVDVSLRIYDLQGRVVRSLFTGRKAPGAYAVRWDGRDDGGQAVASGVYFYRLQTADASLTRKLILLK